MKRPRRRRCTVSIEHVLLFGPDGREIAERNRSGVKNGLTPETKFKKSIRATMWCTISLQKDWRETLFLRCSGGERRDQKFICVGTVRMKPHFYNGGYLLVG